jgi:hypothetical protein
MRAASAIVLLVLLAGCGGGENGPAGPPEPEPPVGGYGTPTGATVEEARAAGGRQLVRGSLVAREGEARLCGVLLESFPPQCGEPSLRLEGLDVHALDGLTSAEGVTWSERELSIHGEVDGDVLRVGD